MPLPAAILAAVIITMIIGALIEILFIRWLHKPSVLRMIIITIGLVDPHPGSALHIWGERVRALPYFTGTSVTSIRLGGVFISPQVLWVIGISAVIVALAQPLFQLYPPGKADARLLGEPRRGQTLRHQCQEHGDAFLCAERRYRRARRAA